MHVPVGCGVIHALKIYARTTQKKVAIIDDIIYLPMRSLPSLTTTIVIVEFAANFALLHFSFFSGFKVLFSD